jgi:alpha-D-ribose 1-methylphosphonate 5-triphosphate synthase subunit PhnH
MLQPAFDDPVRQSQAVFRLALRAMAAPGTILACEGCPTPAMPLLAPTAALALTLCDFETPVWLDGALAQNPDVAGFLRFHTGARLVPSPAQALFALVADSARLPALQSFAQGTSDYPDRSTTLLVQVERLEARGWRLEGPGLRQLARLSAAPLPAAFVAELGANRAQFPRGVDIFLTTYRSIAALPRSLRVTEAA